jgi:hypothetical protein
MNDACVFALMNLPAAALRRVLMKGSIRMIKSLVVAYPQAAGAAFLDALAPAVSPSTLRLLVEEISKGQLLAPEQVQRAEREFIKLVNEEKLLPSALRF